MPASTAAPAASKGTRNKYTSRACQHCRRRRSKCDGNRPSCSRCQSQSLECVYTNEAELRGSGSRMCNIMLQERVAALEELLRQHSIDPETALLDMKNGRSAASSKRAVDPTNPRKSQPVLPARSASGNPSPESNSNMSSDCIAETRYFGETSGRLELESAEASGGRVEHGDVLHVNNDMHSTRPSRASSPHELSLEDIPEDLVEHLIDLYFNWENPMFQVVDEAIFRRCRRNNGRYCTPLLVYSMMAIASRYSDRPEVRTDPDDPNTAGLGFLELAEAHLQADLKWPRITTIQSLSIMAVFYVAIGSDAAGWLHHGMAIRLVLDMGLNVDSTTVVGSSNLSQDEIYLRRQIYWSIYCNDKLLSTYTGRVCTMLDCQGSVPMPSLDNMDLENSDSSPQEIAKRKIFVCFLEKMSTQCQILERILTTLYGPKSKKLALHEVTQMNTFLGTLQEWLNTLPTRFYINFKRDSTEVCKIPHAYTLHMVYYTSIILVSKAYCQRACLPEDCDTCPHASPCAEFRARLMSQCHEAARHISLLGDIYRSVFGSFRRSPLNTVHCTLTAAQVLLCVHRTRGGAKGEMPMYFQSCMDILEELSESWNPARRFRHSLAEALNAEMPRPAKIIHEPAREELPRTEEVLGIRDDPMLSGPPVSYDLTGGSVFDFGQFDVSSETLPWDYVNFDMPYLGYPFSAAIRDQFLQQQQPE